MKTSSKIALISLAFVPFLLAATNGFPARPIFAGLVTTISSGAGTIGGFFVNSAQPSIAMRVSGAAADAKVWDITANATHLLFRTPNDALSVSKTWLDITRAANVPADISLGNATDLPTLTYNGALLPISYSVAFTTGTAAFLGTTANASGFGLTGCATGSCNLNMNGISCATRNCFAVCSVASNSFDVAVGPVVSSANPGTFAITTSTVPGLVASNQQVSCTITR